MKKVEVWLMHVRYSVCMGEWWKNITTQYSPHKLPFSHNNYHWHFSVQRKIVKEIIKIKPKNTILQCLPLCLKSSPS